MNEFLRFATLTGQAEKSVVGPRLGVCALQSAGQLQGNDCGICRTCHVAQLPSSLDNHRGLDTLTWVCHGLALALQGGLALVDKFSSKTHDNV